jgi:diguanylate cyclase (GGDEF)-like protein
MNDEEIELNILKTFIKHHQEFSTANPNPQNKCDGELDMRAVLRDITGEDGATLEYSAQVWHQRLAPQQRPSKGPLRPCSNSTRNKNDHRFHARAFINSTKAPAWERLRELVAKYPAPMKELDQKSHLLYSLNQARVDFNNWLHEANDHNKYSIAVIFLDIDSFKSINAKFTETVVDGTLLKEFQNLLKYSCLHKGNAYRHGGDEFLILLPNSDLEETKYFSNKLISHICTYKFFIGKEGLNITVSCGIALFPLHGKIFEDLVKMANTAEHVVKNSGKNNYRIATLE